MSTLPAPVGAWLGFFGTLAAVSVTFLGLAFVVFQVRPRAWRGDPLLHVIAVRTLGEFLTTVFYALIVLIPNHDWRWAGIVTGVMVTLFIGVHLSTAWRQYRKGTRFDAFDKVQIAATSSLMPFEAWVLAFSNNLYLVVSVIVWLLASGSIEAWLLLDPPGVSKQRRSRFR